MFIQFQPAKIYGQLEFCSVNQNNWWDTSNRERQILPVKDSYFFAFTDLGMLTVKLKLLVGLFCVVTSKPNLRLYSAIKRFKAEPAIFWKDKFDQSTEMSNCYCIIAMYFMLVLYIDL